MLGRFLSCLVFAVAAGSAFAASVGVSAPPHQVAPGTPLFHQLVLGAYRFAFLLGPMAQPTQPLSPNMAALHKALAFAGIPMTDMPGMTADETPTVQGPTIKTGGLNPALDLAIEFGLLLFLVPRLPRPSFRTIAEFAAPRVAHAQWHLPFVHSPPRLTALQTV